MTRELDLATGTMEDLEPRHLLSGAIIITNASLSSAFQDLADWYTRKGYAAQVAYCASKHAMLGMSKALALEVRQHNIHVHCLCPGGVATDFIAGTRLGKRLVGQTMLHPTDVAEACLYVARQPHNVDIDQIELRRFTP